jgi:hypothetical protein
MKCPECKGNGTIYAIGCGKKGMVGVSFDCELCKKTGKIDKKTAGWVKAGEQMREDRIARGLVLRLEAKRRKMDPLTLSQMERGILEPVK